MNVPRYVIGLPATSPDDRVKPQVVASFLLYPEQVFSPGNDAPDQRSCGHV